MNGLRHRRRARYTPKPEAKSGDGFRDVFWLAKKDIGRAWLSYPASGLFVLFLGLLVVPYVDGDLLRVEGFGVSGPRFEGAFNAFFLDYVFLMVGAVLAVNAISGDYMRIWADDVFSHRLLFVRSLPIPVGSLVAARAASMLFALPFTGPAFFLPAFLLPSLGDMGSGYMWFIGVWLGWSLLCAGMTLLCEFVLGRRAYLWFTAAFIVGLIVALISLGWASEISLVARSADLVVEYGPLAAAVALLAGGVAFALLARLAVHLALRREIQR